jgi:hypothetical protein
MVTFTTPSSEVQAMVEKSLDEIEKNILRMASNHHRSKDQAKKSMVNTHTSAIEIQL